MSKKLSKVSRFFLLLDKIIEGYAIGLLVFMILWIFANLIVRTFIYQPDGSRQELPGSLEISLLCLTWFSFMGIAIGFRENLHLGMDMLDNLFSKKVLAIWDKVLDVVVLAFGIYLVYFGLSFTLQMGTSTLPVTGWSNRVQYIVMPITGLLTSIYSVLRLCGFDLRRYNKIGEEIKSDV